MPEVLYSSRAIKAKIRSVLANPQRDDRRVVLVAYIGKDYAEYLPDPAGIEVICSPTPGATSAAAVDGLIKAGATVWFSDKLHMKIYWSKFRGCVVTSANLSTSALGVKGLKEAGVWMEPGAVNVNKLIAEAKPYLAKDNHIEKLRIDESRHRRAMAAIGRSDEDDGFQYLDWFAHSTAARTPWKVGEYLGDMEVPEHAKDILKEKYDRKGPVNYLGADKKTSFREGDWLVQFEHDYDGKGGVRSIMWMTVDFVSPAGESPFIAIQAHSLGKYERPPFPLTSQFKKAFKAAIARCQGELTNADGLFPSKAFLAEIADQLRVAE